MGKYYLIGYSYNKETLKKENEIYYKEFDNLIELDKFTSLHTKNELLKEISTNNQNKKIDSLEARYFKQIRDKKGYSMPIILDNIEFYKTAHNVVLSPKRQYKIQKLDPNVYEERYKFNRLLNNNNKELIDMIYPDKDYDSSFKDMINDYFKNPDDDKYEKIYWEFSRYINYRKWITSKERLQNDYRYQEILKITNEMYKEFTREYLENKFDIYLEFRKQKRKR